MQNFCARIRKILGRGVSWHGWECSARFHTCGRRASETLPMTETTADALRVLFLIPGVAAGHSMVFVRRQAAMLIAQGLQVEMFDLQSRNSPRVLIDEFRRF